MVFIIDAGGKLDCIEAANNEADNIAHSKRSKTDEAWSALQQQPMQLPMYPNLSSVRREWSGDWSVK